MAISEDYIHKTARIHVQWNLSNLDTLGTEESVLISGVVMYTNRVFGTAKSVPFFEVSLFQGCPE